jgi:hypothetical protein
MSVYLVHGLQLAWGKKMVVVFAFGLRLLLVYPYSLSLRASLFLTSSRVIVPAALRLHYERVELASSNPSLDGVMATVCAEIELCYAVVATTIPCLRPFMFALSTNYGGPTHAKTSPGNTTKKGYTISLAPLSTSSKLGNRNAKETDEPGPATRWDGAEYNVNVATGDHESMTSNDSRRMIISKNTEWTIDYEAPSPNKDAS